MKQEDSAYQRHKRGRCQYSCYAAHIFEYYEHALPYVMMFVSEISLYMRRTSAADGGTRYIPEEEKRPHTALGGMRVLWYTERRYLGSDSREGLSITSLCILSTIQIKVV